MQAIHSKVGGSGIPHHKIVNGANRFFEERASNQMGQGGRFDLSVQSRRGMWGSFIPRFKCGEN